MTLFLVGGGPSENLSDVHDVFAASVGARARGRSARVAYISAGRPEEVASFAPDYTQPLLDRLPHCEVSEIYLLPVGEDGADETEWPEGLADVDGVIVAGGHTPSYLRGLQPKRAELARLVREDVPWLGFSAGAHVTSRHCWVGGWRSGGHQVANQLASEGLEEVEVVDGLALITPTVVAHNDTWQTESVAITALEQHWSGTAVAIDEDTCLVVDPITGRTAHYGRGRIRWFNREASGVMVRTQYPD